MSDLLVVLMLRATVLLVAAAVLVLSMRRASAATRHAVWTLAFGTLLLLPAASVLLPRWELAVLPVTSPMAIEAAPGAPAEPAEGEPVAMAEGASVVGGEGTAERSRTPATAFAWMKARPDAGLAVWAIGALIGLARVAIGSLLVRRLVRRARSLEDPAWLSAAADARRTLGLSSAVRLLESEGVAVPVVSGLWRPSVLIPAGARTWPALRRRAFLLHELAHVQRRDCLVQAIAGLVKAMYWPHPLAWWAQRRLRAEAERASDDRVVVAGMGGAEYAHLLLEAARVLGRAPQPLAVVAIVERSSLEDRLVALLDPGVRRGGLSPRTRVFSSIAAATLTALLATVQLVPPVLLAQAPPAPAPATADAEATAVAVVPARTAPEPKAAVPASAPRAALEPAVEGTVTDARGKPVNDAVVLVRNETARPYAPALAARSDRNGRFRVPVPEGTALYRIRVERLDWAPQVVRMVKAGAPLAVILEPGGTIEGVVLDRETKEPISGVELRARSAADGLLFMGRQGEADGAIGRTETDAKGRFRLGSLGKGRQHVGLSVAGYPRASWEAITGESNVELSMSRALVGSTSTSMTAAAAAQGRRRPSELDPEQLATLERGLESTPDNLDVRQQILRHYFLDRSPEGRAARARHALWVIEHAPESDLAGTPDTSFIKTMEPASFDQARALWMRHVEAHGDSPKVLFNAAQFLQQDERAASIDLMRRAVALDPTSRRPKEQLARFYMRDLRHPARGTAPDPQNAERALEQFEAALALPDGKQVGLLADAAEAALEMGADEKAEGFARTALGLAESRPGQWDYGNAIHEGHRLLGHVALRAGEIEAAKKHLIEAGKTPGSPQLNSFGPHLTLASELLAKGEGAAVIEYLQSIRTFWKGRDQAIEEWVTLIRAGEKPELDRMRARRSGS